MTAPAPVPLPHGILPAGAGWAVWIDGRRVAWCARLSAALRHVGDTPQAVITSDGSPVTGTGPAGK